MSFITKERLLSLTLIIAAAISGYFFSNKQEPAEEPAVNTSTEKETETRSITEKRQGGKFTNPLLECDCSQPDPILTAGFLEHDLREYVSAVKQAGKASHVSVYFRDLNNGPWFGLGEEENFTPASLLKVPVMMAAFKRAMADPSFLHKKFEYKGEGEGFGRNITDSVMIVRGQSYSIESLISTAIIHSDNNASNFLLKIMGNAALDSVLSDLEVKTEVEPSNDNIITVKEYSSFFRILYNASYLNKEFSEKALKILTQSTFKDGLVAGLPKDVVVAHKFGERGVPGSGNLQLHDCGIVYLPNAPYLICVMTRGRHFGELSSIIAGISDRVYREVSR
jgi:beta-lactamase class A